MIDRGGRLGKRLAALVVWSAQHARLVTALSFALLVPLAGYAWTHLRVDADTRNLVSDRLPWRQASAELGRTFPHLLDDMQVVIDARSPEIAAEAQRRIAEDLAERTEVFSVVYAPGADDFFERHGLLFSSPEDLEELRRRMAEYRTLWTGLEESPTLSGFASALHLLSSADSTGQQILEPFLLATAGAFYSSRSGNYYSFPWTDLVQGRRSRSADLRRFILAKPLLDFSSPRPAGAAMRAVREAANRLDMDRRAVRVRITGSEAFEHESIDAGLSDVPRLVAGALILVAIILLVALRSARLLAASLCVLAAGLAGTAAFAAVAVGNLNMISVAFAILYVGLGVDYAIHFCLNYMEAREETGVHLEALRLTAERAGVALFFSAVTTALCFYAFMVTDFTGVADLGKIGGTGMLISFVATVGLLPALLSLKPFRLPEHRPASPETEGSAPRGGGPMAWLDLEIAKWRKPILAGALLLAIGSAVLVPRVRFDQDVINMSDASSESVVTLRELIDDPNTAVRAVSMIEPDSARAAAVAARLSEIDGVRGTITLDTFVPEEQEAKLALLSDVAADLGPPPAQAAGRPGTTGDERQEAYEDGVGAVERLRETAAGLYLEGDSATSLAARQLLYLIDSWRFSLRSWPMDTRVSIVAGLEQSIVGTLPWVQSGLRKALDAGPVTRQSLPPSLRERWVAADGVERVQVLPARRLDTPGQIRDFVEHVQAEEPAISGMPVENVELGKVTVRAFRQAFGLALLATAVTLLVLLGDPRSSGFVMASLVLATLFTGAAAVVWSIPFNISNIITLPLLLGIGVDAGIHMVHRRKQTSSRGSLLDTATGRAILYSVLTTMAGFGNLTLASHRAISGMGALLMVGMTSVLACTLIVLPALMSRPTTARTG